MIDGTDGALLAVLDLAQQRDHLSVEHLAMADGPPARELCRGLLQFAALTARAINVPEVRLRQGVLSDDLAKAAGFRHGVKSTKPGALDLTRQALEEAGVPLWRDGRATVGQTLYYRGVWAAIALIFGLGSISVAVFSSGETAWFHIVGPGVLCAAATLFAVWQIALVLKAAQRNGPRLVFAATATGAAAALMFIGVVIYDRAIPSLAELWNIYKGDLQIGDLAVSVSPDGTRLHVDGAYGLRSEEAVRRALDENKGVREVVLAGPGGRIATGLAIFHMIRDRKLATRVETSCASACTIAFLGGIERSLAPTARLGFHRASFPGMSDNDMHESNRGIRRFLIYSAKLTPAFADKVFETPADSIWAPTHQELLAGKVINRVGVK